MRFILIEPRRPISGQRGVNHRYQSALRQAIEGRLKTRFASNVPVYCRILWFHRRPTSQDVDNIVKPILDSLSGSVFGDDYQVSQCLVMRINLEEPYTVDGDEEAVGELQDVIISGHDDILYIKVDGMESQRAVVGPIDGG